MAGRTTWRVGQRIRFYRALDGAAVLLPDTSDDLLGKPGAEAAPTDEPASPIDARQPHRADQHDYDVAHYLQVLRTSYVGRLRKAFAPADIDQIFRLDQQLGLFDRPIAAIQPRWIHCQEHA